MLIIQNKAPSDSGASSNDAVDRLLSVVEKQAETIDQQGRKIKNLEDHLVEYVAAMKALEKKVDNLTHRQSEGKVLEDDEDSYVEI